MGSSKTFSIQGKDVEVTNFSFYSGTEKLHTGSFIKPYTFEMADNNVIEFGNHFWLDENGKIMMVGQIGYLTYLLPDGSSLLLDCNKRFQNGMEMGRIISFHPNGRYKMGCNSMSQKWFETEYAKLNIRFKSFLELDEQGNIAYANKLSDDSFIKFGEQNVHIFQSSEVAFHKNGTPRFFTLKEGEELKYQTKNIGVVTLYTDPKRKTAVKFSEDGNLEVGSIKEVVEINFNGGTYSFQTLAAQFYPTGEVFSIFIPGNTYFENLEIRRLAVPLRTGEIVICLDKNKEVKHPRFCAEKAAELN